MNSFLIILLGLILGTIGSMMLFFMDYKNTDPNLNSVCHLAIALTFTIVGFFLFGFNLGNKNFFSSSDYVLKIEVRQEYLNGQEISVDTVYIFTPKKK